MLDMVYGLFKRAGQEISSSVFADTEERGVNTKTLSSAFFADVALTFSTFLPFLQS